jgi:endonuclease YncB( thermonuclease family)
MIRASALALLAAAFLAGCSTTAATPAGEQAAESGVVSHVVDGDTIDVDPLGRVRLVGIDTPEQDACGYDQATAAMTDLLQGRTVQLVHPAGVADTDPYGRLLRYVDLPDGTDAGQAQLEAGWARTAYDSTDGYPRHSREADYRDADEGAADLGCYSP